MREVRDLLIEKSPIFTLNQTLTLTSFWDSFSLDLNLIRLDLRVDVDFWVAVDLQFTVDLRIRVDLGARLTWESFESKLGRDVI